MPIAVFCAGTGAKPNKTVTVAIGITEHNSACVGNQRTLIWAQGV